MLYTWARVPFGVLIIWSASACSTPRTATSGPMWHCTAPVSAVAFDSASVERLAGDYRLIFVSDSYPTPGALRAADLHLSVNQDTLRRFYLYSVLGKVWHRWRERPLVGWLEGPLGELHAAWSGNRRSENPDAPGVYYEQGYGEFIIGRVPNLMDGASTSMQVTWMAEDGFGGTWRPDLGMVMVVDSATGRRLVFGGAFCAWRQ